MRTFQRVKFDEEKLMFVVDNYCQRCMQILDRSLGRADGYTSKLISAKRRGKCDTITKTDYLLIQSLYGVDISLKEPEPVDKKLEDKESSEGFMSSGELYKVIYGATYDAIMMALSNSGIMKKGE